MKAWFPPLAAGCLAILFAPSPAPAQSPDQAPDSPPVQTGTDQAPLDFSQFKTADDLWAQIQKLQQGPTSSSATPQDVMGLLRQLTGAAAEFQTRYPKDSRRWEARLIAVQFNSMLASAQSQQPDPVKIESELHAIADAPDAPVATKVEARLGLIGLHTGSSDPDTLTPAIEKEMVAFIHDFPDDPNDAQLQKVRLQALQTTDPAAGSKFLDKLLQDKNPAVVQMAQAEVQIRDLKKKPLELQFTASDGSKVDVSKLRGKVVLIDFWATWCGPCMEAVPDVVKVYKELHSKGFEIVGISLDQDKGSMVGVTLASGMVWPQYFDGKGWGNEISTRYGITSIPTMWLLNKKGVVVDTEGEDGLQEKVEKLVAE
jgi:thiol-disulfide isomerase/thioredoxin